MKFVFLILFAFSNLIFVNACFSQSKNFCASDAVGKKYELNLVEGAGKITAKTYSSSGALIGTLNGTWSIQNEGVYGSAYFLTAVFSSGTMKFLVIGDGTGDIQKLQDVVANREFYPCNGSSSRGNSISVGSITVEGNPNYTSNQEKIPVNSKAIVPAEIIGTSKKIGKLEVAQNDFSWKMDWNEAKNACEKLGEGWRLPTKDELDIIHKNRALIGGFGKLPDYEQTYYWSSSPLANGSNNYYYIHLITRFDTTVMDKNVTLFVRAVRTIL